MIKPTNGRIVWFTDPTGPTLKQLAAIVTRVWGDRMVNLCVFDQNGIPFPRTSVPLLQNDDQPGDTPYCEWMPFQKGQAAKHDAESSRS